MDVAVVEADLALSLTRENPPIRIIPNSENGVPLATGIVIMAMVATGTEIAIEAQGTGREAGTMTGMLTVQEKIPRTEDRHHEAVDEGTMIEIVAVMTVIVTVTATATVVLEAIVVVAGESTETGTVKMTLNPANGAVIIKKVEAISR